MILDLKELFEVIGGQLGFDEDLCWKDYDLFNTTPFQTPIHAIGTIQNRAGIVQLDVAVSFVMHLTCDRCLQEFDREYVYEFTHIVVTEVATENDEYIVLPDRLLNLDDLLQADILLHLPSKLLCQENCKGLCVTCGQNKNHQDCGCKEKFVDPRFEVLDRLLK